MYSASAQATVSIWFDASKKLKSFTFTNRDGNDCRRRITPDEWVLTGTIEHDVKIGGNFVELIDVVHDFHHVFGDGIVIF